VLADGGRIGIVFRIVMLSGLRPAAVAPPRGDDDEFPATGYVTSHCAPSPSGDWWRKRGGNNTLTA